MGRKPNPLILEYFNRGPKHNDNSNRYPHTCKRCGIHFERGRLEALMNHITKKCTATSNDDKISACLALNGYNTPFGQLPPQRLPLTTTGVAARPAAEIQQTNWSALEALAEASRQVDRSEKGAAREAPGAKSLNPADPAMVNGTGHFELLEHFDSDPISHNDNHENLNGISSSDRGPQELDRLLQHPTSPELASLTEAAAKAATAAAAAATARLNPSLVDPQLDSSDLHSATSDPVPADRNDIDLTNLLAVQAATEATQAWEEANYVERLNKTPVAPVPQPTTPTLVRRGGLRIDTSGASSDGKPKNVRARFNPLRRKEVSEVRRMGACSRCRILRKTCDNKTPCGTCEKVTNPRVWNAGCIRDKLIDHVELWSAGVQAFICEARFRALKGAFKPTSDGTLVYASLFPGTEIGVLALAFVGSATDNEKDSATSSDAATEPTKSPRVIMIDSEKEDLPLRVEKYVQQSLHLIVENEPSHFMKTALETATALFAKSNDRVLGLAMDLWGLTEIIEREQHWQIWSKTYAEDKEGKLLSKESLLPDLDPGLDAGTAIVCQLSAAAERRAMSVSETLLKQMNRDLHDSKNKVGPVMFLSALILLNCIEKAAWIFHAWDQEGMRPNWPMEKDPKHYYQDVRRVAENLKTLLSMRKILPQTGRAPNGRLIVEDGDDMIRTLFAEVDLDYDTVLSKQQYPHFSPTDPRSLELYYCSHLLVSDMPFERSKT